MQTEKVNELRAALALMEARGLLGPGEWEISGGEEGRPAWLALRAFAREHVRPLASGILTALSLAETAQKGGAK